MKIDDMVKINNNFPLKTVKGEIGKITEVDDENIVTIYKVKIKDNLYLCFGEEIDKVEPELEISKL